MRCPVRLHTMFAIACASCALFVGVEGRAPAQQYIVRDFTPDGFTMAWGYGISGAQQVGRAAFSYALGGGGGRAILYSGYSGGWVDLNPAGYTDGKANAICGTQQVGYGEGPSGQYHALLWTGSAASAVDLNPSGYSYSEADATTGTHQIGWGQLASDNHLHALLWSGTADSAVDLNPVGYDTARAFGASGEQQVGVGSISSLGGFPHALLWSGTAASYADLNPTGYYGSMAYATTGSQEAGWGSPQGTTDTRHAMLWSGSADTAVDLNPAGIHTSEIWGMSGTRQVGYGHPEGADAGMDRAMVWSGTADSAVDLHVLLSTHILYSYAYGIDQNGTIVGYGGDDTYHTRALLWIPLAAATQLAIPTGAPTRIGQTATLSTTLTHVADSTAVVGETVRFKVGGATVGTAVTGAAGVASFSFTVPYGAGPGSRPVAVEYDGSATYAGSSASGSLEVTGGNPAFSLYAVVGSNGQSVNLRTLFVCAGQPIVGRTVQFAVDGTPVGSAVSDASGATLPFRIPVAMASGSHDVRVSFAGDATYNAGSRTSPALWVKPKVAFSLYAASGVAGHSVVLHTLVYGAGKAVAGLAVQFAVDSTPIGTAISDATGASISYAIPAAMATGPHNVTVSFAGNTLYAAATRTTAALTVKAAVLFSLSKASGAAGATVQLKTLVYSGGAPVSGLLIKFAVDGVPAGTATSDSSGASVSYTIPALLAPGLHDVTVTFAGNATYATSTRTTQALIVL